ncbi:Disease resistance protein RGA2 [Morus notabilis]|uniref:Disease resistance protein RGA2 n=1 Tax=Morus notabilis TaxID=981085 RepID=W9S251_9ROSA|nr:Disease resistance protein RGA2 [Morus notabilis]
MAEHEVSMGKGVQDAVENLRRNLETIKAVLKDAEKRQWKDKAVKVWMDELKDITYDMDDVFDEWKTEIEKDGESHETDQRDLFVTKIKVRFSVLCRCFNSSPPGQKNKEISTHEDLYIVPIVEMGGIGKATLAKLVYNNERLKENFDVRAWVCVSDPFDRFEIVKAIVQQLNGDDHERASTSTGVGDQNLETLMRKFHESIKDRR